MPKKKLGDDCVSFYLLFLSLRPLQMYLPHELGEWLDLVMVMQLHRFILIANKVKEHGTRTHVNRDFVDVSKDLGMIYVLVSQHTTQRKSCLPVSALGTAGPRWPRFSVVPRNPAALKSPPTCAHLSQRDSSPPTAHCSYNPSQIHSLPSLHPWVRV